MPTSRNQSTRKLLMTDPIGFCFNEQTALSNAFQQRTSHSNTELENLARKEFQHFVDGLTNKGIEVTIANGHSSTPDAVFPNNVFSTTHDGKFFYFPMANENRREERKLEYDKILLNSGFTIKEVISLVHLEQEEIYLEGTGSMIFHHPSSTIFMTKSIRSNEKALDHFYRHYPYKTVVLDALDNKQKEIYHTNVVMSIGQHWMVACLKVVPQSKLIREWCEQNDITLIEINEQQMNQFGANILEVSGNQGPIGVISETAWKTYSIQQKRAWEKFLEPLIVSIPTIETIGGGSARCMMAEIFLP